MTSFVTPAPSSTRTLSAASASTVTLDGVDCLTSPLPAICGVPTCGDGTICGGHSFQTANACIHSPSPAVLNEFLVGDGTLVGGDSFTYPIVPL